jgi:hypothetical protein
MTGTQFDVTEGQKFNRVVASFTDPGGPEDVSHYQANIDWGDGTTSKGTIVKDGANFRVSGQHTYAEQGNYTIKISASDQGGPKATTTTKVTVHDAAVQVTRTFIRLTVGQPFSGMVARFHDTNPLGKPAEFTATVNWGDGTTTSATIQADLNQQYTVISTHTYAQPGQYAVDVTINDDGHPVNVAHSSAKIDSLPVVAHGLTGVAKVNTTFTLALAAFHNGDASATASIDWGDSTTAGTIKPDGAGGFNVIGSHSYSKIGSHTVRIAIVDNGHTTNTTGTVRVVG